MQVAKIARSEQTAVLIFASCLPYITPNVLLSKRDELIPVILTVVKHHPDNKVRDELTHMLFNLIKKPDEAERSIIIQGCAALAQSIHPSRVESELLPLCWEQINHKLPERRALVAESCGHLAPFVAVGTSFFSFLC